MEVRSGVRIITLKKIIHPCLPSFRRTYIIYGINTPATTIAIKINIHTMNEKKNNSDADSS